MLRNTIARHDHAAQRHTSSIFFNHRVSTRPKDMQVPSRCLREKHIHRARHGCDCSVDEIDPHAANIAQLIDFGSKFERLEPPIKMRSAKIWSHTGATDSRSGEEAEFGGPNSLARADRLETFKIGFLAKFRS